VFIANFRKIHWVNFVQCHFLCEIREQESGNHVFSKKNKIYSVIRNWLWHP
jgi:hypothetical protein